MERSFSTSKGDIEEVQGIKEDMGTSMASLSDEVAKAKEDMEAESLRPRKKRKARSRNEPGDQRGHGGATAPEDGAS